MIEHSSTPSLPRSLAPLRIAFMGTPDFAVPALEALIDAGHDIVCVYTQPPRPKGRGHQIQPSPVHLVAQAHNIPVHTPHSLKKDIRAVTDLADYAPDVAVVAAYGLILPKSVLEIPRLGCLNIHASLLPRWRGASPIQNAILAGDEESGICIMQMDEGLDTGPVIDCRSVKIRPETTAQSLHDELAALGAGMIAEVIRQMAENGPPEAQPQDSRGTTYAPMLKKDDGRVNWTKTASEINRQIRALTPWPGVWTTLPDGARLKILAAAPVDETFTQAPGTLTDRAGHVACGGDTVLRLMRVQPENATAMDFIAALNGGYLKPDQVLG